LLRSDLAHEQKAVLAAGITGAFCAAIFLDYVLGGVSYATVIQGLFLGLASAAPWIQTLTDSPVLERNVGSRPFSFSGKVHVKTRREDAF